MSWSGTWSHGIAIALDYSVEMAFNWQYGTPMTISSRCGLALKRGERTTILALLGRVLNWLNPGPPVHCTMAIAADIVRAQQAIRDLS